MAEWLTRVESWAGTLPAVLVVPVAVPSERRASLRSLAAAASGPSAGEIAVVHEAGRAPRLVACDARRLCLSSASRSGWAALAVAAGPVGIDVERIDPGGEIPWNVLHPGEVAHLRAEPRADRAAAFARLWTVKEAYLKALGQGLAREPASFRVAGAGAAWSLVHDPERKGDSARAETRRFTPDLVVSLVTLA